MKGLDDFEPERYYHVISHAVGVESLFKTDDNFNYFLKRYAHYIPEVCATFAYCLMPNHIHFLVRVHPETQLVQQSRYKGNLHAHVMQRWGSLLNSYAKTFNNTYKRKGALWVRPVKRFLLPTEPYITNVINYIHHNPVRHGFTSAPADWPYSSFGALLSDKPTHLERSDVLDWFGGKRGFTTFHEQMPVAVVEEWEG